MWILPLLGYIGLILGFFFLTLSIASGLYYLSELVEEHSVLSAKLLRRLIYAIITFLLLLWLVDSFPLHLILLSIASHAIYLGNLRHFPVVKLNDPIFIVSCVLVLINHWLWFQFFSSPDAFRRSPPLHSSGSGSSSGGGSSWFGSGWGGRKEQVLSDPYSNRYGTNYSFYDQPTFTEIAAYFGLCVWLVPFALFVSLSAGENVLPSMGSEYATGDRNAGVSSTAGAGGVTGMGGFGSGSGSGTGFKKGHKRRNTGLAKAAVASTREWMAETGAVMGLWKKDNVRSFD